MRSLKAAASWISALCVGLFVLPASLYAQVSWSPPTVIYSEAAAQYSNAEIGTDLATDGSGNAVALWMDNGTAAAKSVVLKSARTSDGGQSWSAPSAVAAPGAGKNVTNAEIAYAGAGKWVVVWAIETSSVAPYTTEFYSATSTNAGATWSAPAFITTQPSPHVEMFTPGVRPMAIAAADDGTVLVSYRSALLRSTNAGVTWTYIPPQTTMNGFVTETPNGARIAYAQGQGWYHAFDRVTYSIGSIIQHRVYLSYSTDNGQTWSTPTVIPGSENQNVAALSSAYANVLVALRGTEYDAGPTHQRLVFTVESTDSGQNWGAPQQLALGRAVAVYRNGLSAAALISDNARVAGATSANGGSTWSPVVTAINQRGLARDVVQVSAGKLLTAVDSSLDATQFPRTLQAASSTDNGATWVSGPLAAISNPPTDTTLNFDATIEGNDAGRMVAAWYRANSYVGQILISRTDDFGHTWTPAQVIASQVFGSTDVAVANPPKLSYVGNNTWIAGWVANSIYVQTRSTDNGVTWEAPQYVQTDVWIYKIYGSNYAGTVLGRAHGPSQYYVRSDDYAAHIGYVPGGEYGQGVLSLGGSQWIKVENGTSYYSSNNAVTWTARGTLPGITDFENVQIVARSDYSTLIAVGANSTTHPTTVATYRSTNSGLTWTRIDVATPAGETYGPVRLMWMADNTWLMSISAGTQSNLTVSKDDGLTWSALASTRLDGIAASNGHAVNVYTDYTTGDVIARRAHLPGLSAAADWQLFE